MIEWFVLLPFWQQLVIIIVGAGVSLTVLGIIIGKFLGMSNPPKDYNVWDDLQDKTDKKK